MSILRHPLNYAPSRHAGLVCKVNTWKSEMSCIHSQLPNIFYLISGTNSFQSILTKCLLVIPCPLLSHSFMATTKVRGCHELTNSLLLPEEDIIPRTEEQQLLTHHVSKSCFASFFWSWPYPPSSFRAAWVLELVDLLPKIWKFNFFFWLFWKSQINVSILMKIHCTLSTQLWTWLFFF